ncbi:DUF1800 domain-containing protein [Pelagibius sp.]|uniref:DUF1800 domain-containing protein n=1 Tax=Pelagibius sp. TaxID=1931238 RepID=UPI003B50F6F0
MRDQVRFVFAAVIVLAALLPASASALSRDEARHLLVRSGFAAEPETIDALLPLSRETAIDRILGATVPEAATPAPGWTADWTPPRMKDLTREEKQALRRHLRKQALELKAWWFEEMAVTASPLTEVMTLFWHNHFTSGLRKVKAPVLMYRQNRLLRQEALGNFGRLLRAVARDPAMLVYLDGARNRKQAPNENFARELFELFTLGEGHYQEADIKDAARAFTGWSVDRKDASFTFRQRWHDDGMKSVLGAQGRLNGDDVITVLLDHPRTAVFIVEKLWRQFISEDPDPQEVERLAAVFREADYEIKPLLAALFASDPFWAPENRGRLIKSPVEFLVGTVRLFDLPVERYEDLVRLSGRLGQNLFDPPNVKGWPGGTAWITASSLVDRQSLLERITGGGKATATPAGMQSSANRGETRRARMFDTWVADLPEAWRRADAVTMLLLPIAPVDSEILDRYASGAQVRQLLGDPAYQLK